MIRQFKLLSIAALLALPCAMMTVPTASYAQAYPEANKPITIILPFPAGGPTDKAGRDLAVSMGKALGGHTVVIQNVTGASGTIGINRAAKSQMTMWLSISTPVLGLTWMHSRSGVDVSGADRSGAERVVLKTPIIESPESRYDGKTKFDS